MSGQIGNNVARASGVIAAGGGGAFENNLFQVVHEAADGTAGGATTASSWQTRTITDIKVNQISGALASNVITLGEGDYVLTGGCFISNSGYPQTRLRDTTNSATLIVGCNAYSEGYAGCWQHLAGKFTLSGSTDMEVQYYCTSSYATQGQGMSSPPSGEVNRWADYLIWQL